MGMTSVQEIEKAIDTLSPSEQEELLDWVDQRKQPIDARLEAELDSGHFDEMIEHALQEHHSGLARPLGSR